MDEFWVCQHCRSLNRAGTGKCYSCRNKFGTRPAEGAPGSQTVAPVAPPPPRPMADFSAASRPAASYSRPVALASATAAPGAAVGAAREPFHFPSPAAAVRRRIARSLALRQSVSVGWLGYLTAALLIVVLAIATLIVLAVLPVGLNLLQHADPGRAWAQLTTGQLGLLRSLSIVFTVVAVLALVCFSLYLGLTTHNATGLGADQPFLTPYRAGTCWAGVLWTQARIAVGLIVPALIFWRGYTIPGLIAALVALEIAHRHLDDFGGWLSRPYRHLPDLFAKLGIEGSMSSPMAWAWSACFRMANAMVIVVCAIPMLAFLFVTATAMAGRSDIVAWQSTGLGPGQITVAVLVASLVGWTTLSVVLLVPITLGFVQRQRLRKTLVRVGRARSWVARPGGGGYTPAPQGAAGQYGGYDEDRIVERLPVGGAQALGDPDADSGYGTPGFGGPGLAGPGLGGPGFGGPGFGGPGQGGPGFDRPGQSDPGFGGPGQGGPSQGAQDQASLYSPSTTSSFPWSAEPPVEPD